MAVAPNAPRDLAREAFIDPLTVARHAYLIVYAFALILCAVAEYFVSAKRFADRGKPPALAGLAPFSLLVAGAANWYQPRSEGTMPEGAGLCFRRARRRHRGVERDRTRLRREPQAVMRRSEMAS